MANKKNLPLDEKRQRLTLSVDETRKKNAREEPTISTLEQKALDEGTHQTNSSLDENAVLTAGERLRVERERKGYSLHEIASVLRLRARQIQALETGDQRDLPGQAFVIGFLRSYANLLGMDAMAIVDLYKKEHAGQLNTPQLVFPEPTSAGRMPSSGLLVGTCLLAILAFGGWYYIENDNKGSLNVVSELPDRLLAKIESSSEVSKPNVDEPKTLSQLQKPSPQPSQTEEITKTVETEPPVAAEEEPEEVAAVVEEDAPEIIEVTPTAPEEVIAVVETPTIEAPAIVETPPEQPLTVAEISPEDAPVVVETLPEEATTVAETTSEESVEAPSNPVELSSNLETSVPENQVTPNLENLPDTDVAELPEEILETPETPEIESSRDQEEVVISDGRSNGEETATIPNQEIAPNSAPVIVPEIPIIAVDETPVFAQETLTASNQPQTVQAPQDIDDPVSRASDMPANMGVQNLNARIVLMAHQESWVQILTAGKEVVLDRVLGPGDTFMVPSQADLKFSTANAAGIEIRLDGQSLSSLGGYGAIIRELDLNPESLQEHFPATQ